MAAGSEYIVTTLALLGKLGISMSYCVCWMHAVEMYPTNIRSVDTDLFCSVSISQSVKTN